MVKRLVDRLYDGVTHDKSYGYELALVTTAVSNVVQSFFKHCDVLVTSALQLRKVRVVARRYRLDVRLDPADVVIVLRRSDWRCKRAWLWFWCS